MLEEDSPFSSLPAVNQTQRICRAQSLVAKVEATCYRRGVGHIRVNDPQAQRTHASCVDSAGGMRRVYCCRELRVMKNSGDRRLVVVISDHLDQQIENLFSITFGGVDIIDGFIFVLPPISYELRSRVSYPVAR